jgi:hypothetical protein
MICAYFTCADNNFIKVIRPGQAYGGNSLCITKESAPDALQKLFVCEKIVAKMWPAASSINLASWSIFARQRNNAAWLRRRRGGGVPPQEL